VTSWRVLPSNCCMLSQEIERPIYPFPPLGGRVALARMLQCAPAQLDHIELTADSLYREVKRLKKDGSPRICYSAEPVLKGVQGRIKCMILRQVKYPHYLMGGLADRENPRDYVRNAHLHAGARVLINEDLADFFPSISCRIVFGIFRYLFRFPEEVSLTLTRLTTHHGQLPQGAKTSNHLANLVFWECEPDLVASLRLAGFDYSRYIDDITVSSKVERTAEEVNRALSLLASMVKRHGFRFKRRKHRLVYAGQRMEVTGLVVGRDGVGLGRVKRSGIRALVHRCELEAHEAPASEATLLVRRRAASLVGQYGRLHPNQGQTLKDRLSAIRRL
jgi:Reverse transcriptase (RNA-dependent DNA polymerase)